ncbi:DUF559 domain-containing protein [Bifidobacterium tissieri]|uniref:DUF559 domain-containing protein n=1 Tax=Bifidobacterium tissieri TaxID=1630162 RepID=A0A5M9ZSQ6_9BIFI|nr:DUF559 domain-containing protein [Bifidobacterium tissieri]KAA8829882.1 DUF559 domain-containing protein [Bifidobacterium tissieri]KAA8830489.1 DUF559 domain-containing protein [Bifidobacterium tissieri]
MSTESLSLKNLTAIKYNRMQACEDTAKRTKDELVFDLCTSLELQAVELPQEQTLNKTMCHVAVRDTRERHELRGVRWHCYSRPFSTVLVERRFRCVALADVWMHYAAILSLEELVVLTDALMRRDGRLRRLTLEYLVRELESAGRFRGKKRCLQALRLAKEGTDSSWETRTRLVPMQFGLPCPEVNYPVKVSGETRYLDMAYPQWRIGIEYDGEHHRYSWKEDSRRRESLEQQGWMIITVFHEDLRDEEAKGRLAQRVASRVEQVTGKPVPLKYRSLEQLADGRLWRYGVRS